MRQLPRSSSIAIPPHPGRRRDKPQLSCHPCRQRKRKCDRKKPCSYCVTHNLKFECSYVDKALPACSNVPIQRSESGASVSHAQGLPTPDCSASYTSPSDGSFQLSSVDTSFRHSTHWSTVLNSTTITHGSNSHSSVAHLETSFDHGSPALEPGVLLFGGCKHISEKELLSALPTRREADSLVSFYFRAQEYRSVIHPKEFLQAYNAFWNAPSAVPTSWLGLLYSILCLTAQTQCHDSQKPVSSNRDLSKNTYDMLAYREKVVQCLIRNQYAKGGPFIMETLLNYVLIENSLSRDISNGVWLLMGNIVQVAMRLGYHRDPDHFKTLSPFEGEMRRRLWAIICSLDLGFSTQMGLPSNIKHKLSDTRSPRNVQDSDFSASSVDLPPARPMTELTSSTVLIAKLHVVSALGAISDTVNNPQPLLYDDLVAANTELDEMHATLPQPCRLKSMSDSLLDPPSVVFQRVNFYMLYQRARILINWKFLATAKGSTQADYSWGIVTQASMHILQLQRQMAEETEAIDTFRPTSLIESCFINNGYFLAASVACFNLQHRLQALSPQETTQTRQLLQKSFNIWSNMLNLSKEAIKLLKAVRAVLEYPEPTSCHDSGAAEAFSPENQVTSSGGTLLADDIVTFFDELPLTMLDFDTDTPFSLVQW